MDCLVGIKFQRCAASKNKTMVSSADSRIHERESLRIGAKTIAPMNPSTTLGTLAINSITGLNRNRHRRLMNSLP